MSGSNSGSLWASMDTPESDHGIDQDSYTNFELSDFLKFDEWIQHDSIPSPSSMLMNPGSINNNDNPVYRAYVVGDSSSICTSHEGPSTEGRESKKDAKERVAFKTKSEVEILDDGYKWRKYGKKMVKTSPNPRNYYRCSIEGCPVKKRVEKDKEDPRYVITTYEGIHNHLSTSN